VGWLQQQWREEGVKWKASKGLPGPREGGGEGAAVSQFAKFIRLCALSG